MDSVEKKRLSLFGRSDLVAAAIRLRAARQTIGLSQSALAEKIGKKVTNINNMERARNAPSWSLMVYLFTDHRIDVNFIVIGAYAQLPADVQTALFEELKKVHEATDLLVD